MMHASTSDKDIFYFYNGLMLAPDIDRIRKVLVHYELFKKALEVPGDIVECGVFKGAGAALWLKLLDIFAHGTNKKVVGFDLFEADESLIPEYAEGQDRTGFTELWSKHPISHKRVEAALGNLGTSASFELVKGPVEETVERYVSENRGFRISLLHLDLDTYTGTLAALKHLYPAVIRGGIVLIDEYATPGWGESDAVDEFFATDKGVEIKALAYSQRPTAYLIKR